MSLNSISLPDEIINYIFEFNPEHREKMRFVLQEIHNMQRCDICESIIIKYIYCRRRSYMVCCSLDCVDTYENQ
jgi:hypothetical protein